MSETTMKIRFYTIADFIEEEIWLREQHKAGWKLVKMTPPCFYTFEKCEPEDVIYRLDYKNNTENADYMQMMADYGWEYSGRCVGWLYFRKPAAEITNENEGELFSDQASRIDFLSNIMKTRLLPLAIIFLCCVIPNVFTVFDSGFGTVLTVFWSVMFLIYVYLIGHCGLKLRKMKREEENL